MRAVHELPFFAGLEPEQQEACIRRMHYVVVGTHEIIVQKGEKDKGIFVVYQGSLEVINRDKHSPSPYHIRTLLRGDCANRTFMAASVPALHEIYAKEPSTILFYLDKSTYESIFLAADHAELCHLRRLVERSVLFAPCLSNSTTLDMLCCCMWKASYPAHSLILKQGDEAGDVLHMLLSGECVVYRLLASPQNQVDDDEEHEEHEEHEEQESGTNEAEVPPLQELPGSSISHSQVANPNPNPLTSQELLQQHGYQQLLQLQTLFSGSYFGEVACVQGIPRTASVVASTKVVTFVLSKHDVALVGKQKMWNHLVRISGVYPSDDDLKRSLQSCKRWTDYKKEVVLNLEKEKKEARHVRRLNALFVTD